MVAKKINWTHEQLVKLVYLYETEGAPAAASEFGVSPAAITQCITKINNSLPKGVTKIKSALKRGRQEKTLEYATIVSEARNT